MRVGFTLNGALADAAIAAWGAKRETQAPRPISMIRYLAFQGQSSDPGRPSFNREGLPLTKAGRARRHDRAAARRDVGQGRRWTPLAATPASPGGVSEDSAFAWAAASARAVDGPFVRRPSRAAGRPGPRRRNRSARSRHGRARSGHRCGTQALAAAKSYTGYHRQLGRRLPSRHDQVVDPAAR